MDKQTEKVIERTWSKETIMQVELGIVQNMLGCRTEEAVEASISFARFLSLSGLSNDNYPLFLKLLEVENHWSSTRWSVPGTPSSSSARSSPTPT